MPYRLGPFSGVGLDEALLELAIDEHHAVTIPRLRRLWTYYRNPAQPAGWAGTSGTGSSDPAWSARRYRLAQEAGLPPRLTGRRDPSADDRSLCRREIVIENDIAWRLQTMVDFMFGKPVLIVSTARDAETRRRVQHALDAVWEASGGIALMQDMALLGHVYGHVDLILRDGDTTVRVDDGTAGAAGFADDPAAPAPGVPPVRIEVVEPTRSIPILSEADYRILDAYIITHERELNRVEPTSPVESFVARTLAGLRARSGAPLNPARRATTTRTEIRSADHWQIYEDAHLIDEGDNTLTPGLLPVVHIQNISQPYAWEGQGEVEPLIPLQDELNTRLSDRASRVTLQSFKMYLATGIDGFDKFPVGPGQIWSTNNPDAKVEAFGGDAHSPSEEAHILEIREALDKTSGVPPMASGVVRAKIGNLTSANALKITMMGILAKTARKRVAYGRGIAHMCRLILTALDHKGLLPTDPRDRAVRLEWSDPLPVDLREEVAAAKARQDLGVPRERILNELGYEPTDAGVT